MPILTNLASLSSVCEVPLPPPGKIQVKFGFTVEDKWIIERPPGNQLPLSNFSYLPLFTCLSVSNVLVLMGCLLQETRVALVSKHYALIGPVSEALLSLLFPFHWQGMYLPILPYSMLEILDAPVPYLVGLHSRYLREVPVESRPQGVVFVDLDCDEVHLGYCDDSDQNRKIPSLPERHALKLKTRLTQCAGCVYVVPPSQRVGFVSNGTGAEIPQFERDPYAQLSNHETSQYSYARRRDILPQTDKAFGDNELLVPLSGFLSEHGRLLQRETTHDTREKKGIFPFVRAIKRSGSFDSVSDSLENAQAGLLDLDDPHGFITIEIRDACLRFFTSLFQTYRMFLNGTDFRSSDFVVSLNLSLSSAAYVSAVLQTQMFQGFVEEHGGNPEGDEVLFFDASINAKINRSKKIALTGRRKETSFLNDTRAMVWENQFFDVPFRVGSFLTLYGCYLLCIDWSGRSQRYSHHLRQAISGCLTMVDFTTMVPSQS